MQTCSAPLVTPQQQTLAQYAWFQFSPHPSTERVAQQCRNPASPRVLTAAVHPVLLVVLLSFERQRREKLSQTRISVRSSVIHAPKAASAMNSSAAHEQWMSPTTPVFSIVTHHFSRPPRQRWCQCPQQFEITYQRPATAKIRCDSTLHSH